MRIFISHGQLYLDWQKLDMTSALWVLAKTSTSGRGIWVTGDEAKQGDLPLNGAGETN